jgi:CspA family cold shock protein
LTQDQIIKCSECGTPFVYTVIEQAAAGAPAATAEGEAVIAAIAAPRPTRCPACRLLAPAEGRQRGVVKWFSRAKGYGFITPVSGADLFVHKSALTNAQPLPCAGQLVEFAAGHGPRGAQAEAVVILQRDERDPECP